MNEKYSIERILRFCNHEMDEIEKQEFEGEMANDQQLAHEVQLLFKMFETLAIEQELMLSEPSETSIRVVDKVHHSLKAEGFFKPEEHSSSDNIPPKTDFFIRRLLRKRGYQIGAIAASLALLIYIGFAFWNPQREVAKLKQDFFANEELIKQDLDLMDTQQGFLKQQQSESERTLAKAINYANQKNYNYSIKELITYEVRYGRDTLSAFYLGMSRCFEGDFKQAELDLKYVTQKSTGQHQSEAIFFLAYSLLSQKNKKAQAREVLEKLAQKKDSRSIDAKKILGRLKNW